MSADNEKFELDNRIPDPGVHPHTLRAADVNPASAKRAERKVAIMFLLSAVGTLLFVWGYLGFTNNDKEIFIPILGNIVIGQVLMGFGLGLALLMIGMALIQWARQLMPDQEVVAERHEFRSSDEDRAEFVSTIKERAATTQLGRRSLIKRTMGLSLGLLGVVAILPLRDLGKLPRKQLEETDWKSGVRLMTDPGNQPIKPDDLQVGSVVQVMPELSGEATLEQVAKDPVLLIRLRPEDFNLDAERLSWTYNGIIAFSKICSHMGCAVALYEQQTHHLLCPCHQSTFDVTRAGKVIFGPAARPLPQLPIQVNSDGHLVAVSDFKEPVGPSFWERNSNKKI